MKKIILITLCLLISFSAYSDSLNHMFSGGSSASVTISDNTTSGNSFDVDAGYHYLLGLGFQLGLDLGVTITDATNYYTILPAVTYNLFLDKNNSLTKAIFLKFNLGLAVVDYETTTYVSYLRSSAGRVDELYYSIEIGKRFELATNITWSPGVQMASFPDIPNYDPIFSINLFRLQVFF